MVFQLKIKNKFATNSIRRNAGALELILSKVKFVAKNVIYLKKWSKNLEVEKNKEIDYSSNDFKKSIYSENLDLSFKKYQIKVIRHPHPLLIKAKQLRQKSFFVNSKKKIDSDEFDQFCDHLIVIDKSVASDFVVGTYRLLFKEKNEKYKKFYSESEFDISNLFKKNISMLEAGRSCVDRNYRDGKIIKLLWRGLAFYIIQKKVDLIFGCASFPSSNYSEFKNQLSYLNHFHKPPQRFSTRPKNKLKADIDILSSKNINKDEEFRLLPPLIKAYIRAGAWIGKGAVVDKKFNTTDVLIILKSENIIKKYYNLSFK
jgi:putative hemolysin